MDEEKEYYSLIKKVFDILAPFYDIVTIPISRVRNKVVNFADAKSGSKILDVATGTGKQAFAFAKKGYDVIGIDLSEAMLKIANRKNKYANVKFEVADATNLPFKNNSFDVLCVSFALHDMPLNIREKVLKEMVRVTKPEGMIVIVDYALPENKIGRFLIYHLVRFYEREYYSKFIRSDLEALLRTSGIEIKEELQVLLGAGRILKGIRANDNAGQRNL
jgi:demethylmenaquinone methyltransferase/2-methoxy-6-polyprenyl-1,4-benzoquinol methylase